MIHTLDTLATIVIRTDAEPLLMANAVQKQLSALNPELPVYNVLTLQQVIGKATASQSFSATLVLSFAVLSLMLAAVGLYGVLSFPGDTTIVRNRNPHGVGSPAR